MRTDTFKWKDEYSVGLELVDKQHQSYLKILNELGDCIYEKTYHKKGTEIFFSLIHFAHQYLLNEKILVNEVEELDYSFFRQKHKEFLNKLLAFQKQYQEESSEQLFIDLYNYLKKIFPEFLSYYTPSLLKIMRKKGIA